MPGCEGSVRRSLPGGWRQVPRHLRDQRGLGERPGSPEERRAATGCCWPRAPGGEARPRGGGGTDRRRREARREDLDRRVQARGDGSISGEGRATRPPAGGEAPGSGGELGGGERGRS